MPKDAQINLQGCLSSLEELQNGPDDAVYSTTYKDHQSLLKSLNTVLGNHVKVSATDADRVLRISLRYTTDVRCVPYVFSIISELINMDRDNPLVDFLPFALAILKFLSTKCLEENTSNLRILSFQVLMLHPKSTLIKLVKDHCHNIIKTFRLIVGLTKAEDLDSKMESFTLLRMLEWLPHNEKTLLVESGISLWLAGVVPAMIQIAVFAEDDNKIKACLTSIEMLAKELVQFDYSHNSHWLSLLGCIADPKNFPSCIKTLLEKGKDNWHRIWIVLVKLLQSQVTRPCNPFGSPINSMLPIVESAFKKDSTQRVRAFACWDELIESFSHETGNCVEKRVKLIIIPLKLNNAKTEETAVAKFNTWWHFIQKFRTKIHKFHNDILVPFLHFMFGKHQVSKQFQAIHFSHNLKKKCIEAFTEIMGHVDCSTCSITSLTPLDGKITDLTMLTDHWKDFVFGLKTAISGAAMIYTAEIKANIRCIWNSFVLRLADMAENALRQDMYDDLIIMVSDIISENEQCENVNIMEILVDDISLPLWRNKKLITLTKSMRQSQHPTHTIIKLIMGNTFNDYFKRFNSEELAKLLHPFISILIEESVTNPAYIISLLDELPVTNNALRMWTTLVQSSTESQLCLQAFNNILRWPFKTVHISYEVKEAALAWYTLYNILNVKLEKIGFDSEISKVLTRPVEDSEASNYFVLFALIGVLKHNPDEEKMAKLEALTYEMSDFKDFEQLMPSLVDTLVLMMDITTVNRDENLAQITMNCVENILKVMKSKTEATVSKSPMQNRETTFSNLKAHIPAINKTMLSDTITSALRRYLAKCPNESIKKQVRSLLSSYVNTESTKKVSPEKTDIPPKEFASPNIQELKKSKKKEASIVNTVVENGEEYVVVKSNWKFNPKNLTENQKEKLQRKRDIPALYQDLSQSQDEFKLSSWKTDSQDTSLSSSKSATSNDVLDSLKNVTNTDIVPKIMENILLNEKNSKFMTDANVSPIAKEKTPKANKLSTPDAKSPRMALKDRVFRNVRNLIEKSSPSPQNKASDQQVDTNILQNVSKSPLPKVGVVSLENPGKTSESNETAFKPSDDDMLTTSIQENRSPATSPLEVRMKKVLVVTAKKIDPNIQLVCTPVSKEQRDIDMPVSVPQTSAERPARIKRKPKKYDDSLILALKKKRYSKNDSQLDSQDLQDYHTETTTAQVHNVNDTHDTTETHSPQKVAPIDVKTTENAKNLTDTDDIVIVQDDEIVTSFVASDDTSYKESHVVEKGPLISPTTPIDKPTQKSPEKPTTGEVPSIVSKASEGVESDAAQNITNDVNDKPIVNNFETLSQPKELGKNTIKKVCAQNVVITENMSTPDVNLRKIRKTKAQKEISVNDENAVVNTPVTTDKNRNQTKLSAKKRVLQTDTDNNDVKVEMVPTPINKTNKELDSSKIKSARRCSYLKDSKENEKQSKTAVAPLIKTKEDSQDKLSCEKGDGIEIENNMVQKQSKTVVSPLIKIKEDNQDNVTRKKEVELETENKNIKKQTKKVVTPLTNSKEFSQDKPTQKKEDDVETENNKNDKNLLITPKIKAKEATQKSSMKKKKSRIEKELMIDMVEGHPFLKSQSEQRLTRKKLMEVEKGSKRKTLLDKLNNSKLELTPKTSKIHKEKRSSPTVISTITIEDSQDKAQNISSENVMDEQPCSEDVIESSQDSTMTTISVRSTKRTPKRQSKVAIKKNTIPTTLTQDFEENHESTDIELPQNKTADSKKNVTDMTENMDTEPIGESKNTIDLTENMDTEPLAGNESDDVIILSETLPTPVTVNSESEPVIGSETQELAEADTQPNDPMEFEKWEISKPLHTSPNIIAPEYLPNQVNNIPQSLPEPALIVVNIGDTTEVSSPFKNDNQRKQDFLNNTLEISPIKVQSPDREKKSPSPETSRDFVVIQLSSPVHSNGEPFEKQCSPEFFTEDKVTSDKRNASPPRVELTVTNASPSSSLSLKKNRPQVNRPSGRAAQMLGLLSVSSDLKITKVPEPEDIKTASTSTPARRNLRAMYHFVSESINDNAVEQNASEENFLKLKRSLPTVTSSPSGPILKRNFADITDESTASPASKRKRVSFHDPPVSTTVSVHKYIEPISLMRSPQSSAKKRLERQTRSSIKSPKKLDNVFLDSALSKTVESFTEPTTPSDDTENISLDVTPVVEIVNTSELNDTDPICPDLIDCTDSIDVIAIELSSPAMRDLFVKELEGKVETVGDLAKMTELEVNRLCIKAPKITVAKKVLTDYIKNRPTIAVETVIEEAFSEPMTESLLHESKADVEMQTDVIDVSTKEIQTAVERNVALTQTEIVVTANAIVQTIESGSKTTEEIIDTCISERKDFIEKLTEKLNDDQMQSMAGKLSAKSLFDLIMQKSDDSSTTLLNRLLKQQSKGVPKESKSNVELSFMRDNLLESYGSNDLILLCSQILQKIHGKPA